MKTQKPLPGIYRTELPLTVGEFHACKTGAHARCSVYVHQFNQHAQCSCSCHTAEQIAAKKAPYEGATYYGDARV